MAFVVRRVVKLVGSGVGLGREAYLYNKEKQGTAGTNQPLQRRSVSPLPPQPPASGDDVYVDLPEEHAQDLISQGHAVPVSEDERCNLQKVDYNGDSDSSSEESVDIEDDWELDEEAHYQPPSYDSLYPDGKETQTETREQPESEEQAAKKLNKLVTQLIQSAGAIPAAGEIRPLPYPVTLPQRRPGAKRRGFVRGYAPDLAASGINQDTFMMFLNHFDEASKASPYLQAVYIGAQIVSNVPEVIAMAVSIGISVAAGTAIELQSRYRANTFLDPVNGEVFMPRGLYAMVMRYKPQPSTPQGQIDLGLAEVHLTDVTKSVARWAPSADPNTPSGPPSSGMKIMKQIRISSGTSTGESQMPTICAPLIFPTADGGAKLEQPLVHADYQTGDTDQMMGSNPTVGPISAVAPEKRKFLDKVKSANSFVNDYYDRRAQADYLAQNPNTTLANQTAAPEFRSRFSDPRSSTNTGLFSLLTGGHMGGARGDIHSRRAAKDERRALKREYKNQRRIARGRAPRPQRVPRGQRKPRGPVGYLIKGVKKVLKEDVLYLMVVQMPSREELSRARETLLQNGWMK